jgi:hypothetical protein
VMRGKVLRMMLLLYPRSWRRRYGNEVRDLADEFVTADPGSFWRIIPGLFFSGFVERFRSWRLRQWLAIASTALALTAGGLVVLSSSSSQIRQTSPRVTSSLVEEPTVITIRVVLSHTRAVAGTPIKGTAVITNRSSREIRIIQR